MQRRATTYLRSLLVGVPTGVRLRHGSRLSAFAASLAYAFAYHVVSMRLGGALAFGGVVPYGAGAWAVPLVGAAIGAVLTWRVCRR